MKLWISVLPFLSGIGGSRLAGYTRFDRILVWMSNLYNLWTDGWICRWYDGAEEVSLPGSVERRAWIFVCHGGLCRGSCDRILAHNFPPARIFMGDVGSVSLGFLLGPLILLGVRDRVVDFWASIMLFSPFIVDAT